MSDVTTSSLLTWEANYKNSMTYIEQFETELRKKYDEAQDEKVLESYRNGITAGQKGTQSPQGTKPQARFSLANTDAVLMQSPSLVMPIWTMGTITKEQERGLLETARRPQLWITASPTGFAVPVS